MSGVTQTDDPRTWADDKLVSELVAAVVRTEKTVYSANYTSGSGPDRRDIASAKAREIEKVLRERLSSLRREIELRKSEVNWPVRSRFSS